MSVARPPILVALRAHLAADRRKTAVLIVLFFAMAVIYTRLFLNRGTPDRAEAASPQPATPANPGSGASAAHGPARAPARIRPARPLVHELTRDPFAVRLDRFEPDPEAAATPPRTQTPGPQTQPAGDQQEFLLQSTISGTLPMAWINGRCVQPGELIDGFVLERVEAARAVLRKGDDVRVLSMD